MRTPSPVLLAFVLAAALAQPAASITIDNFEQGDFNFSDDTVVVGPTFGEVSGLASTNVVGGVRLVRIIAGGVAGVGTSALATTPLDDDGALSTYVGDGNATVSFIYDGVANGLADNTLGTLGLDLTQFSDIRIDATAVGAVDVTVQLFSNVPQASAAVPLVNGATLIPLSGFSIDLADIRAIQVNFIGIDPLDAPLITNIAAVPEPAPGVLVALGLLGLAARRRRSK